MKIEIWHYAAILSKSWQNLRLVSGLHNRAKNELKMFGIIGTNF